MQLYGPASLTLSTVSLRELSLALTSMLTSLQLMYCFLRQSVTSHFLSLMFTSVQFLQKLSRTDLRRASSRATVRQLLSVSSTRSTLLLVTVHTTLRALLLSQLFLLLVSLQLVRHCLTAVREPSRSMHSSATLSTRLLTSIPL